jgi:hypothetical protein
MSRPSLIVYTGPHKKSQLKQRVASRDTTVSIYPGKIQEAILTSSSTLPPSHLTLDFENPHLERQPLFAANWEISFHDEVETEEFL